MAPEHSEDRGGYRCNRSLKTYGEPTEEQSLINTLSVHKSIRRGRLNVSTGVRSNTHAQICPTKASHEKMDTSLLLHYILKMQAARVGIAQGLHRLIWITWRPPTAGPDSWKTHDGFWVRTPGREVIATCIFELLSNCWWQHRAAAGPTASGAELPQPGAAIRCRGRWRCAVKSLV